MQIMKLSSPEHLEGGPVWQVDSGETPVSRTPPSLGETSFTQAFDLQSTTTDIIQRQSFNHNLYSIQHLSFNLL